MVMYNVRSAKPSLSWDGYLLPAIGAGIALYGFAYFVVHEVIIHQRFKFFTRSNNTYIRTIRWAHKMHHKHLNKEESESFGMLLVAKKYWDKVKADKNRMEEKVPISSI